MTETQGTKSQGDAPHAKEPLGAGGTWKDPPPLEPPQGAAPRPHLDDRLLASQTEN